MSEIDISIVIPVFNSADCIEELANEIFDSLSANTISFELIFVDDGSKDDCWNKIINLKSKYPIVSGFRLSKNSGQHKATLCGILNSKGNYIVTIDDDLEHNPVDINNLYKTIKATDKDLVYGVSKNKSRGLIKNFLVKLYKFISKIENADAGRGSSFRIIKSDVIRNFKNHSTHMFFIDEMLLWYTDKVDVAEVNFRPSKKKISGYSYNGLFSLSKNVFMISTTMPLKLVKFLGFSVSFVSFIYGLYHIIHKLFFKTEKGYTSLIISILFSAGLIL
ncbi:MAG: glycosyltransferase, partial [Bacteroidota bacterium]